MKVLVAEDVAVLCGALVSAFSSHITVSMAVSATTSRQCHERFNECRPDFVLLDIELPGSSGLRIAKTFLKAYPQPVVVLMSSHLDQTTIFAVREIDGLAGFIFKSDCASPRELINLVLGAKSWDPFFSHSFVRAFRQHSQSKVNLRKILNGSERRLLGLIGAGLDNEAIAQRFKKPTGTIEWRVKQLRKKLMVQSRSALMTLAQKTGCFRSTWFDLDLVDNYDLY